MKILCAARASRLPGSTRRDGVPLPARSWPPRWYSRPGHSSPVSTIRKKLTPRARAGLFDQIMSRALAVGVGSADNAVIDDINILNATFLAMDRAVSALGIRPGT